MANFVAILFSFFLLYTLCYSADKCDWKCTDEICQKELCPDLPEECMNNTTSLLIPSIKECNCCEHCFVFLKEGEDCLKSTADLQLPSVMCGPGLTCNHDRKCVKMPPGKKDPDFFDNYQCENGRCRCAIINELEHVETIFGEFEESKMIKGQKQCECSVVAYKAMKLDPELRVLPFDNIHQPSARCLPNGQFDPLQCIDDKCGCVDKETGIPDENGFIYTLQALERNHPACFDPSRHKRGDYYTPCEKRRNKIMQEMNEKYWKDFNFIHFKRINCLPDGKQAL